MMKTVKVDKDKLLTTLKANREKHVAEYDEALENYKAAAVEVLAKRLKEARKGNILLHFDLPDPRKFEEDYDQAIEMVEWSLDDEIELMEQDFKAFVLNKWAWEQLFAGTTSIYNNR
jgi:uncharacterized protein YbgA (DUF1722 family)